MLDSGSDLKLGCWVKLGYLDLVVPDDRFSFLFFFLGSESSSHETAEHGFEKELSFCTW